jgi:multidrug efflux pump
MRLPEICIRRPVFATVMSLLIVLVGAIAFTRLTVREYPKIDHAGRIGAHRLQGGELRR